MPLLQFPDSYFLGEERDGFYVQPLMKRAWAAQLEVLEQIRRVCKKGGIRFFSDFGTTLGAVRHNGFIPWDDDLDITMFREDLMKFIRLAKKELPKGYMVINCHDYPDYDHVIVRVTNGDRIRIDGDYLRDFHGCPFAVGLDIFPLDYIPKDPGEREVQIELLQLVQSCMSLQNGFEDPTEEEKEEMLQKVETFLNTKIDRDKNITQQLTSLIDFLSGMYGPDDSDLCGIAFRQTYLPESAVVHRVSCYQEVIRHPFEITTIPVPGGYDELMRQEFGDYMTPKRYPAHDYPFYRNQLNMLKNILAKQGRTLADIGIPDDPMDAW